MESQDGNTVSRRELIRLLWLDPHKKYHCINLKLIGEDRHAARINIETWHCISPKNNGRSFPPLHQKKIISCTSFDFLSTSIFHDLSISCTSSLTLHSCLNFQYCVPAYSQPDALFNLSESGANRTRFTIESKP